MSIFFINTKATFYFYLDAPQRISGKVSGSVNGYTLDAIDLHGYAVTSEGRAYISISRVPPPIGVYLQALFSLGSVLNWLFALPTTADVHNGFMITGSLILFTV